MSAQPKSAEFGEQQDNGRIVRIAAEAGLPSRHGDFRVVAFESKDGKEHAALVKGDIAGQSDVPLRIHSECFTGDVAGSLRCDCRDQLVAALEHIERAGRGVVLYLRQEGRGIGLANKIRAYALQETGLDTVDANLALGFHDDERRYDVAAQMIEELGPKSIQLLSNNPKKFEALRELGVNVTQRIPLKMAPNPHNAGYLATKRARSGHLL